MDMEKIEEFDINMLPEKELDFFVTNENFISLKYKEKEYKQIVLSRLLPISLKDEYISIQDEKGEEIGIIRDINHLTAKSLEVAKNELERRYFSFKIKNILEIKDKMGYLYFDVILETGNKTFAVKEVSKNVKSVNREGKILIIDIDGNRYEIENFDGLNKNEKKKLIPYLF